MPRGTDCASGLLLFCFLLGACDLKASVHKELHHVIGRVRQKHRDPMQLVHVIGGIDTLGSTKGAKHFARQLEVDNVNDLVAINPELAP